MFWMLRYTFFFYNIFIRFGGLIYHNGLVAEQTFWLSQWEKHIMTSLFSAMSANFYQASKQHRQLSSLHFQFRFTHQKQTFFPVDTEPWHRTKSTSDNIKNICSPFRWNCARAWYFSCCLTGVVYEDTWFSWSKLKSPPCAFFYQKKKKKRPVIIIDCEKGLLIAGETLPWCLLWNRVVNAHFGITASSILFLGATEVNIFVDCKITAHWSRSCFVIYMWIFFYLA